MYRRCMIATIPLATGNKLNCFISASGMLAIVWQLFGIVCCCFVVFFCVCFLLIFYMLIIVQPLTLIINQSLTSGIYPDKFKISKITPLHKKDDRTIVSNYRPISLLPTMSKIIERVMHSQLYAFLNENNLITEQQYGFRSNHSTDLATLKLTDTIMYELDNSHIPCAIFLDLSKAFDTLNYKILLRKLKYYGLGNVVYNLIENYLTNRQQFVKLGNVKSKLIPMLIGVPQGSILGPLLLSIYINDLPKSCLKLN